jgi:hypothetical protein
MSKTVEAGFTHILSEDQPYYKFGPHQGSREDGIFKAYTKVILLAGSKDDAPKDDAPKDGAPKDLDGYVSETKEDIGGYTWVRSEEGVEAYAPMSSLIPLSDASGKTLIFTYKPDVKKLKSRFREWHVESLLNQAADLIDKALEELREYNSLDYAWAQFDLELAAQEQELKLDRKRVTEGELLERELKLVREKKEFLEQTTANYNLSVTDAKNAPELEGRLKDPGTNPAYTRAHQAFLDKMIEQAARNLEITQTDDRYKWAEHDKTYHYEMLKNRELISQRKSALTADGQAFDIRGQCELVFKRLERSYTDALDRACVAEAGLKKLYGFEQEKNALQPLGQPIAISINNLAIWVRNSIQWLVAYGQLDQAFTCAISVRSLATKEEWRDLQGANDRFSLAVEIPATYFANHDNVRLRGIGASLIGKPGDVGITPWSLVVGVPHQAAYTREGRDEYITQELPYCLLGRVENRTSLRPIEVCGLISLMNASPVGQPPLGTGDDKGRKWHVEIIPPANSSESLSKLEDIILEINVVGIPTWKG